MTKRNALAEARQVTAPRCDRCNGKGYVGSWYGYWVECLPCEGSGVHTKAAFADADLRERKEE